MNTHLQTHQDWTDVSANQFITGFVDRHKEELFPIPKFSKLVTRKVYFDSIENHFPEDRVQQLYARRYGVLGQILGFPATDWEDASMELAVKNLQKKFGVTAKHIHDYQLFRTMFHSTQVGLHMELSLVNHYAKKHREGITLSSGVTFGDKMYRKLLENTVFLDFHLTNFILFCHKVEEKGRKKN